MANRPGRSARPGYNPGGAVSKRIENRMDSLGVHSAMKCDDDDGGAGGLGELGEQGAAFGGEPIFLEPAVGLVGKGVFDQVVA